MGALVTGSLVPLLKIKFKSRYDGYTDQFNRIFMVKVCLMACVILGLNWFKDTITCIIPDTSGMDGGFVKQACWIQGIYIYRDVWNVDGSNLRYYGIPKKLKYDGKRANDELCSVAPEDKGCIPMHKTFYLQYQWFPFYMGAIALLYYLPYIFYRYVNGDLISLKTNIKAVEVDVVSINRNYFNYQINPKSRMRLRLVGNLFGKIFYVMVNIIAFVATDGLLNNDFRGFGSEMAAWNSGENSAQLDYTSSRKKFRAGEKLLPAFGICEVLELAKDIKHTLYNKHKFVCEISQNVLYQYTLMLLWFCLIVGIVVSIVGLIRTIIDQFWHQSFLNQGDLAEKVYKQLTLRECQYLEYIRNKKLMIYNELLKVICEHRGGDKSSE